MSNRPPPFSRVAVLFTVLAILATSAAFAIYSLMGGGVVPFKYLIPVLLVITVFGWKFSCPRLPWRQAAYAAATVFVMHFIAEHAPPLIFLAEKAIEVVCVVGFGTYWVKKGYIPEKSNRWN